MTDGFATVYLLKRSGNDWPMTPYATFSNVAHATEWMHMMASKRSCKGAVWAIVQNSKIDSFTRV